jgi:hypothetical protein
MNNIKKNKNQMPDNEYSRSKYSAMPPAIYDACIDALIERGFCEYAACEWMIDDYQTSEWIVVKLDKEDVFVNFSDKKQFYVVPSALIEFLTGISPYTDEIVVELEQEDETEEEDIFEEKSVINLGMGPDIKKYPNTNSEFESDSDMLTLNNALALESKR